MFSYLQVRKTEREKKKHAEWMKKQMMETRNQKKVCIKMPSEK